MKNDRREEKIVGKKSSEIQNREDYILLSERSSQREKNIMYVSWSCPFPTQIYVSFVIITERISPSSTPNRTPTSTTKTLYSIVKI
jgi:hypothetical protein